MIIKNSLKIVIEKNRQLQKLFTELQNKKKEQDIFLSKLQNAKSYKIWQKLNKVKKFVLNKNEN